MNRRTKFKIAMSVFRHVFLRWCDVCYFFPRCCGVDSPPMPPSLLYLKPLRNSKTFLHVIYESKKKTNLLCIKNNVFQYSKIRTRNEMRRKALKQKKKLESSPFWNPESTELKSGIQQLESGIHSVESRIQDCHGFPYIGRNIIASQNSSLLYVVCTSRQAHITKQGAEQDIISWLTLQ